MKDNQAKYPQLRFKGFTDPWEQRKLGKMGYTFTGLSGKTKEDFGHGNAKFVTYMNVFSSPVSNSEMVENVEVDSKQHQVEYGDVFFTTSSETPQEVGMSSVWLETAENIYLNSFCFGYHPMVEFDPYYLAFMLRSPVIRKKFMLLAQGISRYNISKNKVMEMLVPVPEIVEQQKIGSFFKQLDDTITLHQRKLDLLKEQKKGYLQKMFPKNGAKVPELRFAGFADDWEEHKLGDIFDVHTDFVSNGSFQALKENVQLYKTENYAYMIRLQDASNNWNGPWLYTDKQGFDFLDKSTVYKDDILMSDRGTIGKFFLVPQLDKPMTLSSNAVLLRSTKNDNNFIYYMLNTSNISNQIIVRTTPGVQPMISKTEFKKINTCIPNIEEQQKIGSFFKQLDDTIALHQRKLEKLQELKKGYLQKMFC